ncbi:MAG TPA: hypothetical protein PK859_17455 [Spirochaetota bacterium]|nr:hypothetical protein [Spirochaetota bacterium]HPR50092.1 hypothetical protein [Spirochaetota bacterium]
MTDGKGPTDFDHSDQKIIDELEHTPEGQQLNPGGVCGMIHNHMQRPGETYIFIDDNDRVFVCYVDHDQNLDEMDFSKYGWGINTDEQSVSLSLVIRDKEYDGSTCLMFYFKKKDRESLRQLRTIINDAKITAFFLSIQYGELYIFKKAEFAIPENIRELLIH